MSQRIGEVVGHHFRLSGSTAGEVHQGDVIVRVRMFRFHERGGSFDTFVEVFESFGSFRPDAYEAFHRRRLWHSCRDMVGDDAFAGTDYHFNVCGVAAVYDVFLRQQVGGGNHHCTEFVQCHNAEPEFITAFQYQHHHVSVPDAEALEIGSRHVCVPFHVGKGKLPAFALVIGPQQCGFVGLLGCPGIHYVVAEVEILRYVYLQVLDEVLL